MSHSFGEGIFDSLVLQLGLDCEQVVFILLAPDEVRISVIVDAGFSLIVDGETVSRRTRRGGAQALGLM